MLQQLTSEEYDQIALRKNSINRSPGRGDSTHIEDHKALIEYIDHYPSYPVFTFSYLGGEWFNHAGNIKMTTQDLQELLGYMLEEESLYFIVKSNTTFDVNNIESATDETVFQIMARPHAMGLHLGPLNTGLHDLHQRVEALEAKIPE